ncbi:MAG: CoA transferase [Acidimicrobiales bacterium]
MADHETTDATTTDETTDAMLRGYRVLDLSQDLAGAGVTRLLAELGPEIIKVELKPRGDPARLLPWVEDGRSSFFVQNNRGKQSLCVDWDQPEGLELIKALVAECDIVVENFGDGVLRRRGLDYDALRRINPSVVMVSVSGFGRNSPYADRPAYDGIIQAYSGMMHMTGDPLQPPSAVGFAIVDTTTAVHAFAGLGYALLHRERTGKGQHVDIAMVDAMFHLNETFSQAHQSKGAYQPTRMGRHHPLVCPVGIYDLPQGWCVLMCLDRQWPYLVEAMGRPDLATDARFATGAARAEHQADLIPQIQAWLLSFPENESLLRTCLEHRIPIGPVLTPMDAIGHPHFEARDMVRHVPDPVLGEVLIPGYPFKFSAQPELPELVAPLLGEHNAAVLRAVLGYDDERIAALEASGVLYATDR